MKTLIALSAALLALAAAVSAQDQNEYLFAYDLGPAEIDVSAYPKTQQENYKVFVANCAQCHTLARTINSPQVVRKEWQPFVERMHLIGRRRATEQIPPEDCGRILDFLVYDAKARKVKRKAEFDAKAAELRVLFEQVKKARRVPPPAS